MKQSALIISRENFVKVNDVDVLGGPAFWQNVVGIKLQNHDDRLGNLERDMEVIRRNLERSRYESLEEYDETFSSMDKNWTFKAQVQEEEDERDSLLEDRTEEFLKCTDLNSQVQIAACVIAEIRNLLKTTEKQEGNYKRQLLMLMHDAVKRNYTKGLFTGQQASCLVRMARSGSAHLVTEEEYDRYDEELYDCDLEVLPAWE